MDPKEAPALVLVTPSDLETLIRKVVREELQVLATATESQNVLTRDDAAKVLQVHPNVLLRYVRDLGLPAHRVGGEWRFLRSEVTAWVRSQESAPPRSKGGA